MDVSFDQEADAVYIRFSDSDVERNREVDDRTILDLDEEGEVVGIEILDFSARYDSISELSVDYTGQKATV